MSDPDAPMEADLVATSERRAVRERLAATRTPAALDALLAEAGDFADRLTDALRDGSVAAAIPCRAGCAWCCHVRVAVTAPEALRIARFLRARLATDALADVAARVRGLDDRTRGLGRVERAATRLPCALLDGAGACSVHPVRPLRCRGWASLDLDACVAESERPGRVELTVESVQWTVARDVARGVGEGIADAGLDATPLELTAALRIALDDPAAEARWLAGEPVFAPAALPPA